MADLLSYALTTVADVKETLGITSGDSTKNNLITRKINQATEMIEGYCDNRRFAETAYTNEEYDGSGTNQLSLRNYPVSSSETFTLEVRDSRTNENSWETYDTELYFVDYNSGVVDALFSFHTHWNRYRVTYTAGYSTIPSDLAEACVTLAAYLVENAQTGTGIKSRTEGRRKIEYFDVNQSGGEKQSLFTQLNIDEVLDRYSITPLLDNK